MCTVILGPNGPVSHGSVLPIIEWTARYIFQMVNKMQRESIKCFDPKPEVIQEHYNYTHEMFKRLVWSSVCRSWFKNGKMHGPVVAVYPGSRLHWFEQTREVRFEDFDITYRGKNRYEYFGNGYTATEVQQNSNAVWYFDDLAKSPDTGGIERVLL